VRKLKARHTASSISMTNLVTVLNLELQDTFGVQDDQLIEFILRLLHFMKLKKVVHYI